MIEAIKSYLAGFSEEQRLNRLREYLHWLLLKGLDEKGYRKNLAFVGGTALHMVFETGRFSEDLDFSLVAGRGYRTKTFADQLLVYIEMCGLKAGIDALRDHKNLSMFFIKFSEILYDLRLTSHRGQRLSIRIEVDKNPPKGWKLEEHLFTDPLMFMVTHFDLSSLLSGKLHALLFRGFDKGRDYYDLIFFLRKGVRPNMPMFINAVKQTHPRLKIPDLETVKDLVGKKIESMNPYAIKNEIAPFLLNREELNLLNPELMLKALDQAWKK